MICNYDKKTTFHFSSPTKRPRDCQNIQTHDNRVSETTAIQNKRPQSLTPVSSQPCIKQRDLLISGVS